MKAEIDTIALQLQINILLSAFLFHFLLARVYFPPLI